MIQQATALFHFSENPRISIFAPRRLAVPVDRGRDRDWLNGPLVWSSDAAHSILYLFPRECPRIVIWPTCTTTTEDRNAWFGDVPCRALAYVEEKWLQDIGAATIYRYRMPPETFEDINDVGMWISRRAVVPTGMDCISDLRAALIEEGVELRVLPTLTSLKPVWQTTLHASGIRLRNAQGWGPPSWTHSRPGRTVQV